MFPGIVCGLCAAFLQDMGYFFSRDFVRKGNSPGALFVHAQLLMGLLGMAMISLLYVGAGMPKTESFWIPLILTCVGSGFGQFFFFRAERKMDPPRVSAMMGLRVVLLALISAVALEKHYNAMQWSGIVLAAVSAVVLNWEGGHFRLGGMKDLAAALAFYVVSDLSVTHMIRGFGFESLFLASLWAMALVNVVTGAVFLPLRIKMRDQWPIPLFRASAPFAGSWLLKQFFLYACYAFLGPVHANVLLSIRGPLAMAISWFRRNFLHLPLDAIPVSLWVRRWGATLLMAAAIVLYSLA
ncbi:MAG: EamA family transporter [Victivallaceae bacterium]|nr:EamA family transporter [Victivallaceae bacterium]